MTKYIFVMGGVISSLGKGISSASIAALLQAYGYKVRIRKMDPYLNVDPGTMSPHQHGEVFVTDDGAETDLDLGHYERFIERPLNKNDSISGGRIYFNVLAKERKGEYLGATVQVIPHVTDEIKRFIVSDITDEDFVIYEIGGTVGDIEGVMFIEAVRQFANEVGRENSLFIYLTLLPYIHTAGELKTKPTQHSVKVLLSQGIQADILLCRTNRMITESEKKKIALFCNIPPEDVFAAIDADSIYKIPALYHEQGVDKSILRRLNLPYKDVEPNLSKWVELEKAIETSTDKTTIAIVAKYNNMIDPYKSLTEALTHAGLKFNKDVDIRWINAESLENKDQNYINEAFSGVNGILVPGGFGIRGIEGKIIAAKYARENKIPYLGICLGMQVAVIEASRHLLAIQNANSTEFDKNCTPVIFLIKEWDKDGEKELRTESSDKGGTQRLGAYPCIIQKDTLAFKVFDSTLIHERHRHRYEMNIKYEEPLREKGMIVTGKSPDGVLPEIIEIKDHPFFIGVQFHPEFKSTPFKSHPLFKAFIEATIK